jgi:hypothetical protein
MIKMKNTSLLRRDIFSPPQMDSSNLWALGSYISFEVGKRIKIVGVSAPVILTKVGIYFA